MPDSRAVIKAYQTVPELFFWDGDIALAAEHANTKIPVIYRLHRSVLVQHSHFFSDTIGTPIKISGLSGEGDQDDWNTHVIHLAGEPDVLADLFSTVYYPQYLKFILGKDNPDICLRALPLLMLAREYSLHGIEEMIIHQVRVAWPLTLREWDITENQTSQKHDLFASSGLGLGICQLWDEFLPEPASAIYFARIANVPEILPAAFYQLSRILPGDDFDGNRTEDGVQLNGSKRPTARWSLLTQDDLESLAAGKKDMLNFMVDLHRGILKKVLFCSLKCRRAFINGGPSDSDDILTDLMEMCKWDTVPGSAMCSRCRAEVNETMRPTRVLVWRGLPFAFKLW